MPNVLKERTVTEHIRPTCLPVGCPLQRVMRLCCVLQGWRHSRHPDQSELRSKQQGWQEKHGETNATTHFHTEKKALLPSSLMLLFSCITLCLIYLLLKCCCFAFFWGEGDGRKGSQGNLMRKKIPLRKATSPETMHSVWILSFFHPLSAFANFSLSAAWWISRLLLDGILPNSWVTEGASFTQLDFCCLTVCRGMPGTLLKGQWGGLLWSDPAK